MIGELAKHTAITHVHNGCLWKALSHIVCVSVSVPMGPIPPGQKPSLPRMESGNPHVPLDRNPPYAGQHPALRGTRPPELAKSIKTNKKGPGCAMACHAPASNERTRAFARSLLRWHVHSLPRSLVHSSVHPFARSVGLFVHFIAKTDASRKLDVHRLRPRPLWNLV